MQQILLFCFLAFVSHHLKWYKKKKKRKTVNVFSPHVPIPTPHLFSHISRQLVLPNVRQKKKRKTIRGTMVNERSNIVHTKFSGAGSPFRRSLARCLRRYKFSPTLTAYYSILIHSRSSCLSYPCTTINLYLSFDSFLPYRIFSQLFICSKYFLYPFLQFLHLRVFLMINHTSLNSFSVVPRKHSLSCFRYFSTFSTVMYD